MERAKTKQPATGKNSLSFLFSLVFLQTALSITPGILLYKNQDGSNWQGAFLLILYLVVSNFSELAVRMQYRKDSRFPAAAYSIKLLLCSVLIIWFASQTQWQFALILFGYELFQTVANSRQYFYLDSFYYTLLNPLFKGFLLNMLFLMKAPIFFDPNQITALLPAFFVSIVLTLFQQGQVSSRNRKPIFIACFLIGTLLFMGSILYLHLGKGYFSLWRVFAMVFASLMATIFTFRQKNFLKAETTLDLIYLLGLIFLYF